MIYDREEGGDKSYFEKVQKAIIADLMVPWFCIEKGHFANLSEMKK